MCGVESIKRTCSGAGWNTGTNVRCSMILSRNVLSSQWMCVCVCACVCALTDFVPEPDRTQGTHVNCSVLQCVAVRCSVCLCVAVYCRVLQRVAVSLSFLHLRRERGSVLQCVAMCCSVLQCVAVRCRVMLWGAVYCSVLQCVAVCCSVLQCNVIKRNQF